MLAEHPSFHPTSLLLDLSDLRTPNDLKKVKSRINSLVEDANQRQYRLEFEELNELIHQNKNTSCTHHMNSCYRKDKPVYEIISYARAAESSTSKFDLSQKVHFAF